MWHNNVASYVTNNVASYVANERLYSIIDLLWSIKKGPQK